MDPGLAGGSIVGFSCTLESWVTGQMQTPAVSLDMISGSQIDKC